MLHNTVMSIVHFDFVQMRNELELHAVVIWVFKMIFFTFPVY